jgi:hypothetical protein
MNRGLKSMKKQKQFSRRWTPMDADVQGICVGRAHGHAACRPQEPNHERFIGVIGVHRRPSAVATHFAGIRADNSPPGKQ